ncbi:hypothetical protein SAMN04487907_11242 [Zunongwangia mangrovi]|uniref:Uncharacterized protein n=1 Tax=Zunongwangia mangrovi TaxID=1334022 RepID=A0A1I1MX60_9FLAO|nr:hypothetical protein [Zunongwangia mangrovi]SFC89981.1 hypothetical protein SAMN04487907_11242 [Zunongwangia mangrovi]
MKRNKLRGLSLLAALAFVFSCESEKIEEENSSYETLNYSVNNNTVNTDFSLKEELPDVNENLGDLITNDAVSPSECAPTAFAEVQNDYILPIVQDQLALTYYSLYLDLNFYYSYFDRSEQYFGEDGSYTNFMSKRKRELERFWDMEDEIILNGQHTATLNDREKVADLYEIVGANVETREDAYAIADQILAINAASPNLPENPFFATDGFAVTNNLIVIGDGIVQMLSETGIDSKIVWTGILSHEWAHQIQFDNTSSWYPNGAADDPAEATRYTELEADFLASYYMTHKRGATYNWKRVEQFFELFFAIGDCSFSSSGHHGTPLQRMEASRLGYELAASAQKKGKILSQQEAHDYFVENIDEIL